MSLDKITKGDELTQSLDLVNDNIARLKELFPEVLTEGKIDFKVLQDILGKEIEDEEEYYHFTWAGKAQARREAHKPSTGTLRPAKEESVNWDTTENLYIEGDNLEVLKLLQKSYSKKVKMIYIDPPYNTGKDFVYKDNYKDNLKNYQQVTGQVDAEGNKLFTNSESDGRYHSNWLNMMYPRLSLARNLMTDDGVIFISISEEEVSNLKKICSEIFGEDNFRNSFIVRRHDKNINTQFADKGLSTLNVGFEYILCYSKSEKFKFSPAYREASDIRSSKGYWKGFWNDADRPTMRYDILGFMPENGQWKWKKETADEAIENYNIYTSQFEKEISLEEYWIKTGKEKKFIRRNPNGIGKNFGVENWIAPSDGILRNTNLLDILATRAPEYLKGLFDFPKNIDLIKLLIDFAGIKQDDIILDFFSGSATSADAILRFNSDKNLFSNFICVQLPEPTNQKNEAFEAGFKVITEIGKERIRRAGKKIINDKLAEVEKLKVKNSLLQEDQDEIKKIERIIDNLDTGFKVFKLDSSNIKGWDGNPDNLVDNLFDSQDNIKQGRTEEDVLFEILLKYGLDLTLPIEEKIIEGKKVFSVGFGALFICLADNITSKVAEGIGTWKEALKPEVCRVIFKDSGFGDVEKTNSVQTLKRFGIKEIKSI